MKKNLVTFAFFILIKCSFAQIGLEGLVVEKYYKSSMNDTTVNDLGGILPVGSITYRFYLDLLPNYKFQAVYGLPGHELRIETSTLFFNNEDRGDIYPSYSKNNAKDNTVMLDSWLSSGAACIGNFGVLKTEDNDSNATVLNAESPQVLQNDDQSCGIPIKTQDGLQVGVPGVFGNIGIDTEIAVFGSQNDGTNGPVFSTTNGSWYCLGGSTGADSVTNKVLIAQITTNGVLKYKLNVQIETPSGGIENYVAEALAGDTASVLFPSLNDSIVPSPSDLPGVSIQILSGYHDSICSGDSIKYQINITHATEFHIVNDWYYPNGNPDNEPLIDSFNLNPTSTHIINLTGYYNNGICTGSNNNGGVYVTVSNAYGTAAQSFIPTVFSPPDVFDLITTNIPCIINPGGNPPTYFQCQGGYTNVNFNWTCSNLPLTINWNSTNNNSNANSFDPILNPPSNQWYYYTLENSLGCAAYDSIYVNVVSSPNTPVITSQVNNFLFASENASNYQWYLNGVPIIGATFQSYLPPTVGLYTVEAINSNCCSSPISLAFLVAGYEKIIDEIQIFPNPIFNKMVVNGFDKMSLEITNNIGEKVFSKNSIQNIEEIDLSEMNSGLYFVRIFNNDKIFVKKVIKN
jgi:hypothetical protein